MIVSRRLLRALAAAALLAPAVVLAADPYPPLICTGLFGCGRDPNDVILLGVLPTAAMILIQLAGGGAVIAIVIAGVQMVTSYGDEGKISNAHKAILYAMGGLGVALAATSIVSFIATEDYGQGGPDLLFGGGGVLATVVRIVLIASNVAIVLVAVLAGVRMVTAGGNSDEFRKSGNMIKWALIGAVIVNLAKVLVQAFLNLQL